MFTSVRRLAGPAICVLLVLGAVAHPAFAQTYQASPSTITLDIYQGQNGVGTEASSAMGGLPSVSCKGATVSLDLGSTWQIYRGNGFAYVQYESDLMPSWTSIVTQGETESGSVWPPYPYSGIAVSVSNLSTLQFRIYLVAGVGGGGYVLGSATLENVSVTPKH